MKIFITIISFLILGGECAKSKSKSKPPISPGLPTNLVGSVKGESTVVKSAEEQEVGTEEIVAVEENQDLVEMERENVEVVQRVILVAAIDLNGKIENLTTEVQKLFSDFKNNKKQNNPGMEEKNLSTAEVTMQKAEEFLTTAKKIIEGEKKKKIYQSVPTNDDDDEEFDPLDHLDVLEGSLTNLVDGTKELISDNNPNEKIGEVVEFYSDVISDYKTAQANKVRLKKESPLHIFQVLKTLYVIGELVKKSISQIN